MYKQAYNSAVKKVAKFVNIVVLAQPCTEMSTIVAVFLIKIRVAVCPYHSVVTI